MADITINVLDADQSNFTVVIAVDGVYHGSEGFNSMFDGDDVRDRVLTYVDGVMNGITVAQSLLDTPARAFIKNYQYSGGTIGNGFPKFDGTD